MLAQSVDRNLQVDDFVTDDFDNAAQILEVHISNPGYKSYKLQWIEKRPEGLEQVGWYPAPYVGHVIVPRDNIKKILLNEYTAKKMIEKINKLNQASYKEILQQIREMLLEHIRSGHLQRWRKTVETSKPSLARLTKTGTFLKVPG